MARNNALSSSIDPVGDGGGIGPIDPKAWVDIVYRRNNEQVFRVCMRFAAGDRAWALDRTQDVFMRLLQKAETVQARGDPMGWLYRVAVNTCCMHLRKRNVASRFLAVLGLQPRLVAPSAEATFRSERAVSEVEQSIADLAPNERAVMVLMHLDNRTQSETASLLGISQGQVSKLHAKAVSALRAREWDVDDA